MITKTIVLACAPARAFALFTESASEWWPASRRHTSDALSEIRMLESGRFWERAGDGTEVELGRVRAWEPPHRLVLDFYPGTDANHPTEVVVTFIAEGEGATTRVTIEHRPTVASAALWDSRAPRYVDSWDSILDALSAVAARS
jgi:uncharacterized protein YndB with AHSA1/START domain